MDKIMQENKNTSFGTLQNCNSGTVCIDTYKVLDCCRDRDCFEDTKVYLTASGVNLLQNSSNIRTKSASILCAYVGVEEVPFNYGFYQVTIRYYIKVELEICVNGKSNLSYGLSVVQKDVILYGGEGNSKSYSSGQGSFCSGCFIGSESTNEPIAVTETVEPVVLGTKYSDCSCTCGCTCKDYVDFPECVIDIFGDQVITGADAPEVLVSFGLFSVIRIIRPTQLLVNATDYSVPDKECASSAGTDNPCALFRAMPFPISQFGGDVSGKSQNKDKGHGGCGCQRG